MRVEEGQRAGDLRGRQAQLACVERSDWYPPDVDGSEPAAGHLAFDRQPVREKGGGGRASEGRES
jgi:hypothetical protein